VKTADDRLVVNSDGRSLWQCDLSSLRKAFTFLKLHYTTETEKSRNSGVLKQRIVEQQHIYMTVFVES